MASRTGKAVTIVTLTAIVRTSVSSLRGARWLKKPSASSKPEKAAESRKDRQDRQRLQQKKGKTVAPEKGGKEKGGRIYTRRLTQRNEENYCG